MAERLKIAVSTLRYTGGKVAHVVMNGVLDAQTVEAFEDEMEAAIRVAAMVVLDVKELTAVSSAGAGAFLVAARNAEERGGALALAFPGPAVRDVLVSLGLDGFLLPMRRTLEEAVAYLRVPT